MDFLSASTDGTQILVTQTSTPGTLLHTHDPNNGRFDRVWLRMCNVTGASVTITVEWAGTTSPDDTVVLKASAQRGEFVMIDGRLLGNGHSIRCFATSAVAITVHGEVEHVP